MDEECVEEFLLVQGYLLLHLVGYLFVVLLR
jgi:hypothetical protein